MTSSLPLSSLELPGLRILRDGTLAELEAHLGALAEPPARLVHYNVVDAAILGWYAARGLGSGMVLSGVVGGAALDAHLLDALPAALFDAPDGPVQLTAEYRAALRDLSRDVPAFTPRRLGEAWFATDTLGRRVLLQRASAPDVHPALAGDAHLLALLDWDSDLRKLASLRALPAPVRLLRALAHPLAILDHVQAHPEGLDPALARRNTRYAVLYGLAARHRLGVVAATQRALREAASTWTDDRDRWLHALAVSEAEADPARPHAAGVAEPLTLLDVCRLVVHRARIVEALGLTPRDRFSWLVDAAAAVAPMTPDPDDLALIEALYGPSPEAPVPRSGDGVALRG